MGDTVTCMSYPLQPESDSGAGQTTDGYNYSAAIPRVPANASRARRLRTVPLVVGAILVSVVAVAAVTGWIDLEKVTGGHAASAVGQVSGDRDAWSAAVCAEGSVSRISDGRIIYPNVDNYASCMSRVPGSGGGVVPIQIGEWESVSTMRRDLARSKTVHCAASAQLGDHVIAFAPIGDIGTVPLEPLVQFGFSITALR